ncbi:hypothetical protein TRL7639_01562 [Falsiruegeria litorea R37]|uniref:Uncharacterized protein n=1 Tax=Falsiruegeria litorea R37 TaxID=1200284 RepID=A0A1Y5S9H6_9RHOB|nr:hypothetical protein [Falsiruegeria litorea]SLN34402.1 hypothetical protein TRL7639_01562 [Falsiruegeria litorea R37]
MIIQSTKPPSRRLDAALKAEPVTPPQGSEPMIGLAILDPQTPSIPTLSAFTPAFVTASERPGDVQGLFRHDTPRLVDSLANFAKSNEAQLLRAVWKTVLKPNLPDPIGRSVDAVWLVGDGAKLYQTFRKNDWQGDLQATAKLAIESVDVFTNALILANAAAGRPTDGLGTIRVACRYGKKAVGGANPSEIQWMIIKDFAAGESAEVKTVLGIKGILDAAAQLSPEEAPLVPVQTTLPVSPSNGT